MIKLSEPFRTIIVGAGDSDCSYKNACKMCHDLWFMRDSVTVRVNWAIMARYIMWCAHWRHKNSP